MYELEEVLRDTLKDIFKGFGPFHVLGIVLMLCVPIFGGIFFCCMMGVATLAFFYLLIYAVNRTRRAASHILLRLFRLRLITIMP